MKFLEWLKALFSFGKSTADAQSSALPQQAERNIERLTGETDTGISYRPNLVNDLKGDHQHLLGLYSSVLESINKLEYGKIAGQLEVFKTDFNAHLGTENIKFYGYLEQQIKENESSENYKQIRNFRREMNSIANAVNKFLSNWISTGVDSASVNEFTAELKDIGAALVKRIESEENSLYPIYDEHKAA
jgi:hemerythrin-like domain-containing protein